MTISTISDKDDPPTEQDHADSIMPPMLEVVPPEPKFCINCKHLLGVRYQTHDFPKWRCLHPNNLTRNDKKRNLVTGIEEYIRVFKEESIEAMRYRETPEFCGPTGKWYEEYIKPEYKPEPSIQGVKAVELAEVETTFPPDVLKNNREAAAAKIAALKLKRTP